MTNVQAPLMKRRAVALYRVSTARQGRSGLGLEAQQEAVRRFMGDDWCLVDEIVEVASGRPGQRAGLDRALSQCRAHNAVLLIARLCRLSRDPIFLMELERSGVPFIATDMPMANTLTIRMMSILAAEEARLVSERTRQALAARKERGFKLGGNNPNIGSFSGRAAASSSAARAAAARQRAHDLMPVVSAIRSGDEMSLAKIAQGLNERGVPTPRGARWQPQSVSNLLKIQAQLGQ